MAFTVLLAAALRWPARVVDHAGVVGAAVLAITLLAVAPLIRLDPLGLTLRIDPSTEPLLPARDPAQAVYRDAVAEFGNDEVFVVAMQAPDVFTADALARLRRVTDAIARMPEVRKVQSLTDVVAFHYDNDADWLEVGSLIDEIPTDPAVLAALRERSVHDPLYRRTIVSEDGGTAAVNVTFRELTDEQFIDGRVGERIDAILAGEAADGVQFHLAGRPHVKRHVYHRMLHDLTVLIPVALAVLAAMLVFLLASRRGVLLPLGLVGLATLWTFGAIAALGRPLTVLTVLLAPMLVAIGSVYGIHALGRYEEEARRSETPRQAALATLVHLRVPVLLAGLTTMAGFAALLITDVPAVFEVGAFSVLGVGALTLLTLTALPAALAHMPLRRAGGTRIAAAIADASDRGLEALARGAGRHATPVILVFGTAFALALAMIPRIEIDTDYLSFFSPRDPVRLDFEAVNRLLAGAVPLYVSLAGPPGAFREPEALHALERIQSAAERSPWVGRTLSLADTVRVMNRAMAKDDPAEERIPETRGGAAELLFMAPKGDIDSYTNVNHARANVLVRTSAIGTRAVREVTGELEAAVADARLPAGIRADVTGNAVLLAHSADGIASGQPRTLGVAAIAIFLLVVVAFRSPRLGLVAMIPNLVPVAYYFGVLGLFGIPLSLPTSLIGSIALGISLDDTVHFLVRFGQERARGLTPMDAVALCGRRVGRSIVVTSLTLIAGFLVMSLSGFATLRQFGLLSALTMAMCLVNDLVLLPALLVRSRV